MQALIDAQPKNLNGYVLTFQFADGTYTITTFLDFHSFFSGSLRIQGNTGESVALHTNQAVILDGTAMSPVVQILLIRYVTSYVEIKNLCIKFPDSDQEVSLLLVYCLAFDIAGCYFLGSGTTTASYGIESWQVATGVVNVCYFSNSWFAIMSTYCSSLFSINNDDTGTSLKYGLGAAAAHIYKSGTQPSGSIADETISAGGEIT
jgi:hypothetical protein